MYIYIYIYIKYSIYRLKGHYTANLPTNIVDFRGVDSKIILSERGGILMSVGDFPESLSQAMLVGVMLGGRLGVSLKHLKASYVARESIFGMDHQACPDNYIICPY